MWTEQIQPFLRDGGGHYFEPPKAHIVHCHWASPPGQTNRLEEIGQINQWIVEVNRGILSFGLASLWAYQIRSK